MEDRRVLDALLTQRASISPDAWLRARAALASGRLRVPEASPTITLLSGDPEPSVRRAAMFAIGLSGDRRLLRFAVKGLKDADAAASALAAEALGKLGGPEASDALVNALSAPAAASSARALFRAVTPAIVERLTPLATAAAPELRRAALYALARRPLPEAAPALRRALDGDDPELVAYAARALGILADRDSVATLARLAGRPEPSIAVQALLALEKLGAKGALPGEARTAALARCEDPIPGVAVAALKTLSRFPGSAEVGQRLATIATGEGWRGQTALVSFAAVDAAAAGPLLARALSATSLEPRLAAAEALGTLPPAEAVPLFQKLLDDRAPRVRELALASLPKPLSREHPELLIRALKDADAGVRSSALEAAAPHLANEELARVWLATYQSALTSKEADDVVSALDAAVVRTDGGRALIEPHVDHPQAVVRGKARRLMVEKFGAPPEGFRPRPVETRLTRDGYLRAARAAFELRLTATLKLKRHATPIEIELALEDAPLTVLSFRELADRRYFDGIVFHRVVPDFVVQTGDPRGDGSGGPGWAIRDEINPLRYARGAVGMALSGPDTGGSQWFVTLSPQPHLDGGYTVFGRVVKGMEVADAIEQDDVIERVTVTESKAR